MVAGALLLATVWVFLLRYVPDRTPRRAGGFPALFSPTRSDLLDAFAPASRPGAGVPARCSASSADGCSPDGCSHRYPRSPRPPARPRPARSRTGSARGPQRRVPRARRRVRRDARASRGARRRAAEVRRERLPRAAHPARDHPDPARRRPQGPGPGPGELVARLHDVNSRAIGLTEALLLLSRADQRSFTPRTRRPVAAARRMPPRRSFPSRRSAGSPSRRQAMPPRPSARRRSCSS